MIPVDLSRILITETSDQQVIWLKEHQGERSFPIVIGIFEAVAIRRKLNEEPFERPMTHDLLASVISQLDAQVDKIVVTALKRTTFYAKIVLRRNGSLVEIDSRPSDAIALAVRVEAPIFVEEELFDLVGKPESRVEPDEEK
ncbi:MAG TPA: bifunctional nuclease family protein [Planctomycetota bacterium]|nr:bifunctional nuclease family protein [Planctomycetota bacterium]